MISLLEGCRNIQQVEEKHWEYCKKLIIGKIENELKKHSQKGNSNNDNSQNLDENELFFFEYIKNEENLRKIILGEPRKLEALKRLFNCKFGGIFGENDKDNRRKNTAKEIFDYENLCKKCNKRWDAVKLVEAIGINTCPYCNRQYVFSFKKSNSKSVRPSLDHFYCRSKYPYFGLSLYNLIPSCDICNSRLKLDKEFTLKRNLHPYTESFHDHLRFSIKIKEVKNFFDDADVGEIDFVRKGEYFIKAESNAKVFNLKAAYEQGHKDYIAEQIFKARVYNDSWARSIMDEFAGLFASEEVLKRFYFGNYVRREDINKRPLAKLTIDILEEFGIK